MLLSTFDQSVHWRGLLRRILLSISLFFVCYSCFAALDPSKDQLPPADHLEPRVESFEPRQVRGLMDEDRVQAAALFAHGRMLYQREDFGPALTQYQRSYFLSPNEVVLKEAVPLAFELGRVDEASRYALTESAERTFDPILLRQLAMFMAEQLQFDKAVLLYQKSLRAQGNVKEPGAVVAQFELGRLLYLLEQFDESSKAFDFFLAAMRKPSAYGIDEELKTVLLGQPAVTYAIIGESYLAAKRMDKAEQMFRQVHQARPNAAILAMGLARVNWAREDRRQAEGQLQNYLDAKTDVAGVEPYVLLAKISEDGDLTEAENRRQLLKHLIELRENDTGNLALGYFLADQYRKVENIVEAESLYVQLSKEQPTGNAYRGLCDIYRKTDCWNDLLRLLGEVAALSGDLDILGNERQVLAADDRALDSLFREANGAISEGPLAAGVGLALGHLALESKRFDEADKYFAIASEVAEPDGAKVLVAWGLSMFMADQYGRAANILGRLVEETKTAEDSNRAVHYFYLAGALELAGKTERALQAARKATQLDGKSTRIQGRPAWILYHAERYVAARQEYLRLLDRFDDDFKNSEIRDVVRDAKLTLSNIAVLTENVQEAEEWLVQVLCEFPGDPGASNDLGYLWVEQGARLPRALRMIQLAVQAEPDNQAYRDSLGWAYYRLKRYDEAVTELKKAAQSSVEDPIILEHLGDALEKAGNGLSAVENWRAAIAILRNKDDQERIRQLEAKIQEILP